MWLGVTAHTKVARTQVVSLKVVSSLGLAAVFVSSRNAPSQPSCWGGLFTRHDRQRRLRLRVKAADYGRSLVLFIFKLKKVLYKNDDCLKL